MKLNKKGIFAAVAVLLLAAALFVGAGAADDVTSTDDLIAALGGDPYAGCDPGSVVYLKQNVTLSNMIPIKGTMTLDLAGKTISANASFDFPARGLFCVQRGADFTITDSVGGGKITVGNVIQTTGAPVYSAVFMINTGETADTPAATLTVNGGTLEGYYYGIVGNGSTHRGNTVINISGGTIKGTAVNENAGIYHPQSGILNITGGTIEGATGIYVKAGEVTSAISGTAIIKGTGSEASYVPCTSGFQSTGSAIVFDNCGYPGGMPNAEIKGGKFISENNLAIQSEVNPAKTELKAITQFITLAADSNLTLSDAKNSTLSTIAAFIDTAAVNSTVTVNGIGSEFTQAYDASNVPAGKTAAEAIAEVSEVKGGSTEVTYTLPVAYTIVIPPAIELDTTGVLGVFSALSTAKVMGKNLNITLTHSLYTLEDGTLAVQNKAHLSDTRDKYKVGFTLNDGQTNIRVNDTILTLDLDPEVGTTLSEEVTATFTALSGAAAGDYTGQLTFTFTVDDKN